jgi:hypothetical protein
MMSFVPLILVVAGDAEEDNAAAGRTALAVVLLPLLLRRRLSTTAPITATAMTAATTDPVATPPMNAADSVSTPPPPDDDVLPNPFWAAPLVGDDGDSDGSAAAADGVDVGNGDGVEQDLGNSHVIDTSELRCTTVSLGKTSPAMMVNDTA